MDTLEIPFNGKKLKMLNVYCEGAGFHICSPLWNGASAKEVRKFIVNLGSSGQVHRFEF